MAFGAVAAGPHRAAWPAVRGLICVAFAALSIAATAQPALAENITVVAKPSQDRELDEALRGALNLPILISGGAITANQGPAEWEALLNAEQQRLLAVAQSFGYLEAQVQLDFTTATQTLYLTTTPGPVFRIAAILVGGVDGAGVGSLPAAIHNRITEDVGAVARGDLLTELMGDVLERARGHAFPFATLAAEIEPDPVTRTASIHFAVTLGPVARFGEVTFDGPSAAVDGLSRLVPFSVGDRYDPQKIREFEDALATAPRVRWARVEVADQPGADGMVSVVAGVRQALIQGVLARFKLGGIVTLGLALATLLVRQLYVAGRPLPTRSTMIGLDMATFTLVVLGLVIVALRVTSFAQMA